MNVHLPNWIEVLGWTLLNTLWQGLLIFAILTIMLRLIPSRQSRLRYVVSCGAIGMFMFAAILTFAYLIEGEPEFAFINAVDESASLIPKTVEAMSGERSLSSRIFLFIDGKMPWILAGWVMGVCLFSVRLARSWWYVHALREDSEIVENAWSERLRQLARECNVGGTVILAESVRVDAPIVVGWIKPMVIVPLGMLSGLSAEQIETIFIHELAHIRRRDYLINLLQSWLETVLFFNPFVWMISEIVRREREFCCDDEVLRRKSDSLAYARTLAAVEAERLKRCGIALSLAENKKQLLNRIRRIMEKSVAPYTGKERLIPVVLLIVGLGCASWLTIGANRPDANDIAVVYDAENIVNEDNGISADTIDKKKPKTAYYSRKSITTYDENGQPHEEVVEEFEGDDELREMMEKFSFDDDFRMPPMPALPFPKGFFNAPMPFGKFDPGNDTLPGPFWRDNDWDDFREEFEKRFKERFEDFYKSNGKDLERLMDEMEETFHGKFNDDWMMLQEHSLNEQMKDLEEIMMQLRERAAFTDEHLQQNADVMREWARNQEAWVRQHQQRFEELARDFDFADQGVKGTVTRTQQNLERFLAELQDQLVKDGYFDEGDRIRSVEWDGDENLVVNGQVIRDADHRGYAEIRSRYFKGRVGNFRYVE